MEQQNYNNHRRIDPRYHLVMLLLTFVVLIGAVVNLFQAFNQNINQFTSVLILLIAVMFVIVVSIIRSYPLKAQDRAIHAEEKLRHFMLTGKRMDVSLTHSQVIALRFASDTEFPALCEQAAAEKLTPDAIKKAIVSWRADRYRI